MLAGKYQDSSYLRLPWPGKDATAQKGQNPWTAVERGGFDAASELRARGHNGA